MGRGTIELARQREEFAWELSVKGMRLWEIAAELKKAGLGLVTESAVARMLNRSASRNGKVRNKPRDFTLEKMQRQPFGRLTVIAAAGSDSTHRKHWLCQCECGKQCLVRTASLVRGTTRSCGCLIKDVALESGRRHRWKGCGEMSGSYFSKIKEHARGGQRDFTITMEYIWNLFLKQDRRCALTGRELQFARLRDRGAQTASLDRIDSSKGYVAGNVQWIHKDLQGVKGDLDETEFIRLCKLVVAHQSAKRGPATARQQPDSSRPSLFDDP